MKLLHLKKMLLVAVGLLVGASVWAAGYTRTLTADLSIPGYKAKTHDYYGFAFYDFQTNWPAVLPESGDLRYREAGNGGYWGLHNFGSGVRSAVVTIPVVKGDILVIQEYDAQYITTINRGKENEILTSGTGYRVFDITETADDITFTVPRYGGIVAALIMEVDEEVATGNYSIFYKYGNEIVKTVFGTDVVGSTVPILSSFIENGVKYLTNIGQSQSFTIMPGENTFEINVIVAPLYTCTVNAKADIGWNLASSSKAIYSGETATVYYQKAYKHGTTWYMIPAHSYYPSYGYTFTNVSANDTYEVNTFTANEDVVYFGEVEDMNLIGEFAADGIAPDRYSNGSAKRLASIRHEYGEIAISCVYTDNLSAGVYTVTMWARNQSGTQDSTLPVFLRKSNGDLIDLNLYFDEWYSSEQGEKSVDIVIPDDGETYSVAICNNIGWNSNLEMDYIYITKARKNTISVKTSDTNWATLYSDKALNFYGVDGLTAYAVTLGKDATVVLKAVNTIPANKGVVLKGVANTYEIPVIVNGQSFSFSEMIGSVTENLIYDENDNNDYYILGVSENDRPQFYKFTNGSIAAGEAYLKLKKGNYDGDVLNAIFDDEVVSGTVTYAIQADETHKAGESVDLKDGKEIVVTLTFGFEGGADFKAGKLDNRLADYGYSAFTEGNGENGTPDSGTTYIITPEYDGEISVGVVLNADKPFYVTEDGTVLERYNGITEKEKYYGIYYFVVKGGSEYKIYSRGSKLGFYGFNYTYNVSEDNVSSISTIEKQVENDAVYNLQGQKVQNPKRGLYIVNGKKVFIK